MQLKIGQNVKIYTLTKIINIEVISIGCDAIIDDLVFLME